ncbi:MAG: tetratricopeptide repeat protein [Oligoflexales bacterium]|nr:tetratricopeptide repeat protein [Oligoflexales bacterium]
MILFKHLCISKTAPRTVLCGLFVPMLFSLSCLSTKSKQDAHHQLAPLGDDIVALPETIWSPSQRRNLATYYYLSAEQLSLSGKVKESYPLYEAAYNLDPNGFLGGKMIASKAALGDVALAQKDANKMALLYPEDANIHFLFGRILLVQGDFEEAILQFSETVRYDEHHEAAYLALIELQLQKSDFKEAEKSAIKMTESLPWSAHAWVQLTRVYLLSKQLTKALQASTKAYELHEDRPELVLLHALTLEMNGESRKAIPLFEQLFRMNPNNEELLAGIVDLYRKIGDLEEALKLIDSMKVDKSEPTHAAIIFQKAILLWELDRHKESLELISMLVEQFPESDRFLYMQAWALEHTKQFELALKAYKSLPEGSSFVAPSRLRQAIILLELKQYAQAQTITEAILAAKKDDWQASMLLANIHADQKQLAQAIEVLQQALKLNPEEVRILFMIGVYQEQNGEWSSGVETMKKVISQDPKNASAMNFLGYLYAEKGVELDEAERLISLALKLKPDDGYYMDSLGWVFFQKGDYTKALDLLLKAAEKAPDEGIIYEHIGDVYIKLNNKDKAKDFYMKASVNKVEERDKLRLREKLKLYNLPVPDSLK